MIKKIYLHVNDGEARDVTYSIYFKKTIDHQNVYRCNPTYSNTYMKTTDFTEMSTDVSNFVHLKS